MRSLLVVALLSLLASCAHVPKHTIEFFDTPCIEPFKDYTFQTCKTSIIRVDGDHVIIPKHFITDLASIPRPLWPILAPSRSSIIEPSILHDYLYKCPNALRREEVDAIFYDALIKNGNPIYQSYAMYVAVRLFGAEYFQEGNYCALVIDLETRKNLEDRIKAK